MSLGKTLNCPKTEYRVTAEMLHVPGLTANSNQVWTIDNTIGANQQLPAGAIALGHSN